jgi:alkanesulfonate monooxygenase SsuD/methylene tetrahydromethanopterin reductase-like flavin-dependent oxidoreductase (luciferase family)
VVDQLARGRLEIVLGAGHDQETFDMFGVDVRERAKRVTEAVETLRQAFTGEPFEFRGRTVRVTPTPHQPDGPPILMGGNSEGAARRAARIADGFVPGSPQCWEFYLDELEKLGKDAPQPLGSGYSGTVILAEDPERTWEQITPYLIYDVQAHGIPGISDAASLRASGLYRVLTPEQYLGELAAVPDPVAGFAPMSGGIPPELGWEGLHLFEREVLPKVG